jgi:hypothetical protein
VKIIVSHDVDHLSVLEHLRDWMVPKYLLRAILERGLNKIRTKELYHRCRDLLSNRWNNIEALMAFDASRGIPATYFLGVRNGRQLSYPVTEAERWVRRIREGGFEVGVHGICYDSEDGIRDEWERFRGISGQEEIGIRMHCLSHTAQTLAYLDAAGYRFDCTLSGLRNPFRPGEHLWEFPLQLMDADLFCDGARWQSRDLEEAKRSSLEMLNRAEGEGLEYFTLLFHDFYYSDAHGAWKAWYEWFVDTLAARGFEFTHYQGAIQELERKSR